MEKTSKYEVETKNVVPPDLTIIKITDYRDYTHINDRMMDIKDFPYPSTHFKVKVANIGQGIFRGKLLFRWADNQSDIDSNKYPRSALVSVPSNKIEIGDTIIVGFTVYRTYYMSGRIIQFILRGVGANQSNSHSNESDLPTIEEIRFDNNGYVLKTQIGDAIYKDNIYP